MKIASACIYALNIPFVESFCHNLCERNRSDSIIVKLTTECGTSGFGEGAPRPYVTGETVKGAIEFIKSELLPAVIGVDLKGIDIRRALIDIDELLPDRELWNASRCAVELALVDCLFRGRETSVNTVLPARSQRVTYSGVVTAGSVARVEKVARRCHSAGLEQVKVKVCGCDDLECIAVVRDIMGASASIRIDANGAFDMETATRFLSSAAKYRIECIEQPIPRGDPSELAELRAAIPVPVMADESLVTIQDARELMEQEAADYFNLRISKCGGLRATLAIAELAQSAGIGLQLGCQVGETAVLSAAGRHVAAHLEGLRFSEGSYGTHLLAEDIAQEDIAFGHGGHAPVLTGPGLGITVREEILDRYAHRTISVG